MVTFMACVGVCRGEAYSEKSYIELSNCEKSLRNCEKFCYAKCCSHTRELRETCACSCCKGSILVAYSKLLTGYVSGRTLLLCECSF